MGECKQENNTWVTPHGLREDTLGLRESPSWVSVSRPAKDFCDQKIEELDPNLFVCQEESAIMIYKTDIQELNCWQEEPEQLHTIPRITKNMIIDKLGNVEQHGESFPTMPTIPELSPATPTETEEVAGDDDDNRGPEENDLEPDRDDSDYEEPTPGFVPTRQQMQDLQLAHENAGHPSAKDFARMLRRGNAKPEIANWVSRNFRCPECDANRRPKSRRPTAVPRTYRFNHVVGIDLVDVKYDGVTYHWLNAMCWGTGLQLVYPLAGDGHKTPENVWETYVDSWTRVFGMPEIVVMDPGTEFKAHFAEMASGNGTLVLPTDPRAPWQNGRTERAGKEWKIQFRLARDKDSPQNFREWRVLGLQCCAARNQYHN